MTKLEMTKSRAIPGFSCLQMKQELQERIYRETAGMSDTEFREYLRQGVERADRRRAEKEELELVGCE